MNANGINAYKAALLEAHRIRWEPGFNDLTFLGWFTVVAYLVAAWLAWRAGTRAKAGGLVFGRRFWTFSSALFVSLAINKQLDLQVLLTDAGRYWAVKNGLYQQRRLFQEIFIGLAMTATLALLLWGNRVTRNSDSAIRLALVGLLTSGTYILIRAASFHHVDTLLRTEIFGMRWDWMVEMAGLAVVAIAAWRYRSD